MQIVLNERMLFRYLGRLFSRRNLLCYMQTKYHLTKNLDLAGFLGAVLGSILFIMATSAAIAGPYELLVIKDTNYPIPPDALYIATNGDDANFGSRTNPFRTISRAIDLASHGDTIIIRQGTYREALPDISKRLVLQPFPHEQVWLKGSVIVMKWEPDGDAWRSKNWHHKFCNDCYHTGNIDPEHPVAGFPNQVFIDGEPLKQVTARIAVKAGTFYVDDARSILFIGSPPRGRIVEASIHNTALKIWQGGQGSVVRGLGFAHYSPVAEPGLGGMVKANADNLVFENNIFAWSAVKGLVVFAEKAVVRGNTFIYNGMMGLGAWQANGLAVTNNRFAFNNQEGFAQSGAVSEAAGAKLTSTRNLVVTDNLFEGNLATGLWLDINVTDAVVTRNILRNNLRHGIHYEISSHGIIASNIITANRVSGITLANASHIQVYNNTFAENAVSLLLQSDDRINGDPDEISLGNTWISGDTVFHNNLISRNTETGNVMVWVRDFGGELDADTMLTASDFNGYYRRYTTNPSQMVEWWRGTSRLLLPNLKKYTAITGQEPIALWSTAI